jgi:cadmium resistance protein CadD (predicted permease)
MKKLFGGILLAIGVLIAGTAGLCTGFVVLAALPQFSRMPGQMLRISPILLVGIIPCLIGIAIAWLGQRMLNEKDDS